MKIVTATPRLLDASAAIVLGVRPGRRAAVLNRERQAFAATCVRSGVPPRQAEMHADAFASEIAKRVEAAGGGGHH